MISSATIGSTPNFTPVSHLVDVFHHLDVEPVIGEGVWLTASNGRRYLDFYGGHAVALLGYNHPRLVQTLSQQARTLFFQSNVVELEIRRRAAAALVKFAPPGLDKVLFTNSGAEANEAALRTAFLITKRQRVVAVKGAFHGRTAAASALTNNSAKWYGFPRLPFDVTFVPFDDADALRSAVTVDTAAVIFEPVQGLAGARVLSEAFVQAAREAATRAGAILIFDDVQCGMGRTGFPFSAQAFGVPPDILTTAKGIAGGFPCAATLMGDRLAAQLKKGDLGTTFGGGPMACALVEAVIQVIESDRLLARVQRVSQLIRETCVTGPVTAVQGMGLLLGLRTTRPAKLILAELRERGILAGTADDPTIVRLLPPLIIEESHVAQLAAALKDLAP